MASAQRAKILVGIGKARLAPADPLAADHYQALPAATLNTLTMKWFLIIWMATVQWPVGEARWMDGIVTDSEAECRRHIDSVNEREHIVRRAQEHEALVLDVDCMPAWWFDHHAPEPIRLRPGHTT
jgi:hypothetical protein